MILIVISAIQFTVEMFVLRVAVLLAALCLPAVLADTKALQPPSTYATPNEEYRLSQNIDPVNYNLTLRPYLLESDGSKRFTFDGEVYIELVPKTTTNIISLHSKNLTYISQEYWAKSASAAVAPIPLALSGNTRALNTDTDILNFTTSGDLIANTSYILHIVYTGLMQDDMQGFYRSYYTNDNNETKWLGSTQFQTHHARRAFPCFDEPRFKATFDVTIKRHQTFNSVSNTRLISSTPSNET